jgi:hypothetical protein
MKLGKKPAKLDSRTLTFKKYLPPGKLPPPPRSEKWIRRVASWPMMLNDKLGDCTCATAGHMIEQWTAFAGDPFTPADQQILDAYEAIGGYKPGDHATDHGAHALDVLNYWRKTGIAGHKILGYVSVDPKNRMEVMDSVVLFGNCFVGFQLPLSTETQTHWAVPQGGAKGSGARGSRGGHAIPIVGYNADGLTGVTWGHLIEMTWGFFDEYCDEAFAVLSHDWISNVTKLSPSHFDLYTLHADLRHIDAKRHAASADASASVQ